MAFCYNPHHINLILCHARGAQFLADCFPLVCESPASASHSRRILWSFSSQEPLCIPLSRCAVRWFIHLGMCRSQSKSWFIKASFSVWEIFAWRINQGNKFCWPLNGRKFQRAFLYLYLVDLMVRIFSDIKISLVRVKCYSQAPTNIFLYNCGFGLCDSVFQQSLRINYLNHNSYYSLKNQILTYSC